jgi:hypothetical protein
LKTGNSSSTTDQVVPIERPTGSATLTITLGPAQLGRAAEGDQAHYLIATFGIVVSALIGVSGAVLTLHTAANLTTLALAELGLACAAAVLIAVCSRRGGRKGRRRSAAAGPAPTRPRERRSP